MYLIYITPLSQYMLESPLAAIIAVSLFEVSLRALHTWNVQYLPIIIFKILQALLYWLLIIARQPFSSHAIDVQSDLSQNYNSATQELCSR